MNRGLVAAGLLALLAVCARADEVVLADMSLADQWQIEVWSKAPASISAEGEPPAGVPLGDELLRPLAVTIDWPGGSDFRFVSLLPQAAEPVPFAMTSVRVWISGDSDGHAMELHLRDAEGQDRKLGLPVLDYEGWREVRLEIPTEWQQPLTLASITWHNWGMSTGGTAVTRIAGLLATVDPTRKLVEGDVSPRLVVAPDAVGGLVLGGERGSARVRVLGWSALPEGLRVTTERQGPGEVGFSAIASLEPGGGASFAGSVGDLTTGLHGVTTVRFRLTDPGGKVLAERLLPLASIPAPAEISAEQRLRSPIGVNTHLGAPWAVFGRLGIHWARDYSWTWLGRGESLPLGNGRDYQAVAREAEAAGVTVLPVMQGAFRNADATGYSSDAAMLTASFERLSRAFPGIPVWEPDNEFDLHIPAHWYPEGNYENALLAMAEGLTGGAQLSLTGTAGIRYEETADLLHSPAAESFAIVNSHFYTGTEPPEEGISDANFGGAARFKPLTAVEQLARISSLAHRFGKESWLTETGWDVTYGHAVPEELQGVYLPRIWLLSLQAGADKVFWFYDRDVPNSTDRFSSSGLLRLDGSVRPSGIALAQLSSEIATARYAGDLDLGDDRFALAFERPDGSWSVAQWSPSGLAPAEVGVSVDSFGNRLGGQRHPGSVVYSHLASVSDAQRAQLATRWTECSVVTLAPGETAEVRLSLPAGASVAWEGAPAGIDAGAWQPGAGNATASLRIAPEVQPGPYRLRAVASGEGWTKRLPLTVSVEPALRVETAPFVPGEAQLVLLRTTERGRRVTVSGGEGATVAPRDVSVEPGRATRIAVAPDAGRRTPISLHFACADGSEQEASLPCLLADVPGAGSIVVDGVLLEWPIEAFLPAEGVARSSFAPSDARVALARSAAGLAAAFALPASEPRPGVEAGFWESTCLELFADPRGTSAGWGRSSKQLFAVPLRQGEGWRVACGLWGRTGGAQPAPGALGAARMADGVLVVELLLPWELLGGEPEGEWRLAVAAQLLDRERTWDLGWPSRKADGMLLGPRNWGVAQSGE